MKDTAPEQLLIAQGFPASAIQQVTELEFGLRMLDADRLDLFAHTADSSFFTMRSLGIDPHQYQTFYVIQHVNLYFGLNKSFSDSFVNRMQQVLDEMKQEDQLGRSQYNEIINRYNAP